MQTSLYLDRKALVTMEERQLWVVDRSPAREQGPGFQWEDRGGTYFPHSEPHSPAKWRLS